MILSYSSTEFICFNATVLWLFQACPGIDSFNAAWVEPLIPFFLTYFVFSNILYVTFGSISRHDF